MNHHNISSSIHITQNTHTASASELAASAASINRSSSHHQSHQAKLLRHSADQSAQHKDGSFIAAIDGQVIIMITALQHHINSIFIAVLVMITRWRLMLMMITLISHDLPHMMMITMIDGPMMNGPA
eukprot:1099831-Karenia_brevis.AAC.1